MSLYIYIFYNIIFINHRQDIGMLYKSSHDKQKLNTLVSLKLYVYKIIIISSSLP